MTAPRYTRLTAAGGAAEAESRAAARAQLVVVPDSAARGQGRTRTLTVGAAVAVVVGLFAIVFLHVVLSQGQVKLDRLETQAEELEAQNQRLRVEVAELESPNRVVSEARQKLGMAPPTSIISIGGSPPATAPGRAG